MGIFMSIFRSGFACGAGVGELEGICMPGMLSICCGDALGEGVGDDAGEGAGVGLAAGICIPGIFSIESGVGLGVGVGLGILMSMPSMSSFFCVVCRFFCGVGVGLGLGFGMDLLMSMPCIPCVSC
jgi:hypothetical protein